MPALSPPDLNNSIVYRPPKKRHPCCGRLVCVRCHILACQANILHATASSRAYTKAALCEQGKDVRRLLQLFGLACLVIVVLTHVAMRSQKRTPERIDARGVASMCKLETEQQGGRGDGVPPSLGLLQIQLSNTNSVSPATKGITRSFCGGFGGYELAH